MSLARPGMIASTVSATLLSLLLLGCPKPNATATDAGPATSSAADASAAADGGGEGGGGGGEDVEPVYPVDTKAAPEPLAEKLCDALTTIPESKRAACCKSKPGIVITTECTRQLSAAIRHHALTVEAKDVDACVTAFDKALEGCDWVGPFGPGPPAACKGIFKGQLKTGAKCRSSLECTGVDRCHGLGPTTIGRCGPPATGEESCGGTVDSLATYTRQDDVDKRHPECKDRCIKHKCQPPVGESGACLISADCQDGMQCLPSGAPPTRPGIIPKKCVAGKAPSKEGEPCPGDICEGALQCIRGKCAMRKGGGEACTDDFECRGGCLKAGDAGATTKGTCGPRCDIR